jgi:tRNA(Ile)-lysidine synthase
MASIETILRKTVARFRMIVAGDKVLVAFSGGPDSSALLDLLLGLRQEVPFEIGIAHFNHKLRASASLDEEFVRSTGRRLRLPLFIGSRDVRTYARRKKLNLEEAGRVLRYEFLQRTAARWGATKIATGHTLSDQAETFLLRLLRGSGMRGLAGVYPVVDSGRTRIIRPLIEIPRKAVMAYCRAKRLSFRIDESNADLRFFRNKIREKLVPYLERRYDPHIAARLGLVASILQEDEAILETITAERCTRLIVRVPDGVRLNAPLLAQFPRGLARRCARAFIRETKGDLRRISLADTDAVVDLGDGKMFVLPGGIRLRREGEFIFRDDEQAANKPYAQHWAGRRPLRIPEAGMTFSAERIRLAADFSSSDKMNKSRRLLAALRGAERKERSVGIEDSVECYCDASLIQFPLVVRSRTDGDRYRPLGSPGRRKLNEVMRGKRIPVSDRNRLPVFCSGADIVWVPGLPVAEGYKVTPRTRSVFLIRRIG